LACVAIVLASGFGVGRNLYLKTHGVPEINLVVGNHHIDHAAPAQHVTNAISHFVPNMNDVAILPFFNYYDDATGRQNFWASYAKTLSFGDFLWPNEHLASIINWLVFNVICITLIYIVHGIIGGAALLKSGVYDDLSNMSNHNRSARTLSLICVSVAFVAQIAFRLAYPFTTTHNARFTYAVIIPLLVLLMPSTNYKPRNMATRFLGDYSVALLCVYTLTSTLFYMLFIFD
jgi:hypothetical protein